ncbi:S-adenosyl-L-methionine-dependent methyltransferase [Dendryphion nanum]|uniref:S-adenosyl-L-methionine-dependent methyltransferase n=1 Tax=Dendryphion nanum TaxID=256645 RepID=A0A9P9D754_9PLEO|nr:S-adenosyl-L-methionine-dependent methyltransferase [Dendryphion nanum]
MHPAPTRPTRSPALSRRTCQLQPQLQLHSGTKTYEQTVEMNFEISMLEMNVPIRRRTSPTTKEKRHTTPNPNLTTTPNPNPNPHHHDHPPRANHLLSPSTKVSTYETTGGTVTTQFASHNLSLLPPIPSASTVHDNAAGSGTITRALLSTHPSPTTLKIHATDTDQIFLDDLESAKQKNNWSNVEIANAKSEALPFENDTFTHSITNMGIFFTPDSGLSGAKEIYRTLKPGGIAVANCWETIGWFFPLKLTHDILRPGAPYPAPVTNWSDGMQLQKIFREAGFAEEKWRVERSEAWVRVQEGEEFRGWAEKTWAYLGGIGGWREQDAERWDEAVEILMGKLKEAPGTKNEDGYVKMKASQWVIIAEK